MIIAVAYIKGGVGKTTLSVNLAIHQSLQGHKVLLIDADAQGTATMFSETRGEKKEHIGYTIVRLSGKSVHLESKKLAQDYHRTIIDVGGQDTVALRAALLVCDQLIIPIPPCSFDLWTYQQMSNLIEEVKALNHNMKIMIVLNNAHSRGKDNQATLEALKEYQDQVNVICHQPIVRRKVFMDASSVGLSIFEYTPADSKAIFEFTNFINTLHLGANK